MMKYSPRLATFHLEWWDGEYPCSQTFANEADAHIAMAALFEQGIKIVEFQKSVVYEVEK